MATPAPMDAGRYFSLVRLASCLKRMPDFAVTSVNMGRSIGFTDRARTRCNGLAARARDRKDRRFILRALPPIGALRGEARASGGSALRTCVRVPCRPGVGRPVRVMRRSEDQ